MRFTNNTDYIDLLLDSWNDELRKIKQSNLFDTINPNYDILDHITQVVYHNPATIVYFDDGDKVVVKTSPHDDYNPEAGLALCILKKLFGNNAAKFHRFFKTWEADRCYD